MTKLSIEITLENAAHNVVSHAAILTGKLTDELQALGHKIQDAIVSHEGVSTPATITAAPTVETSPVSTATALPTEPATSSEPDSTPDSGEVSTDASSTALAADVTAPVAASTEIPAQASV